MEVMCGKCFVRFTEPDLFFLKSECEGEHLICEKCDLSETEMKCAYCHDEILPAIFVLFETSADNLLVALDDLKGVLDTWRHNWVDTVEMVRPNKLRRRYIVSQICICADR